MLRLDLSCKKICGFGKLETNEIKSLKLSNIINVSYNILNNQNMFIYIRIYLRILTYNK